MIQTAAYREQPKSVSKVRPFRPGDIAEVAEIHRMVFETADAMSPALLNSYAEYFTDVFLRPAEGREELGSLVYENEGRISGFLGSAIRPMSFRGRPVIGRVSTQFAVHPGSRGIPGIQLLKAFFAGPQDFAIADESNTVARSVWQGLGGVTIPLQSIIWMYPLRPCTFGLYAWDKFRGTGGSLKRLSAPLVSCVDNILSHRRMNALRGGESKVSADPMDPEVLRTCLADFVNYNLRPSYDSASLAWVLDRAARVRIRGELQKVVVRNEKGEVIGWYVYSPSPDGLAEVLQLHAKRSLTARVFTHLLCHAGEHGATAVAGRLDHQLMETVAEARCLLRSGPWFLVHSRDSEVLRSFERGDVLFSRLEGEWCQRFR